MVLVPVGFVSDHLEVKYDLDVEAAEVAARHGVALARAATPGTDPRFVAMVTELVAEQLDGSPPRAWAVPGPWRDSAPPAAAAPGGLRPALPERPDG